LHEGGSSRGDKESLDGEDDATVVEGQVVEPVQQGFRPYGTAGDEFVAISWRAGPYPDPEDLAKYEAILPGFTDRILTLTERETDHRIASERRRDDATISLASRGQVLAFIVVMTLVGGGIASILTGHSLVGFAGLIVAAATLAGAFIAPKVFSPVSDEPARPGAAIEPGTQHGGSDDTKDATP
jgi:uncharacterized membrane protein